APCAFNSPRLLFLTTPDHQPKSSLRPSFDTGDGVLDHHGGLRSTPSICAAFKKESGGSRHRRSISCRRTLHVALGVGRSSGLNPFECPSGVHFLINCGSRKSSICVHHLMANEHCGNSSRRQVVTFL